METTRKFRQLPPLAAVPFAGFPYAVIESRKGVVSQLRNLVKYCLKEATSPAVQVILGEWGEGKTEAYARYIKTVVSPPNRAHLVSASTIAQSLPKVRDDNPLASLQFLAAVFNAVRHEDPESTFPPRERFASTAEWLEECLRTHERGRVIIFVDEFEELILDPPSLKSILSGLKELVNGQYHPVAQGGEYQGLVSFFVSCTPDAYARMQRDPDIAEVFGSWERRATKVVLASVRRREAVHFLHGLLRFCYEDDLPSTLPIADSGVFYTLSTIARGNLGALVSLFTKVLNAAVLDDDTVRVVDGALLLDILGSETLSVYGASTKCVERGLVDKLESSLGVEETRLFRLLAGEQRPFRSSELVKRLGLAETADVSTLVARLNQKLATYTAGPPIQQLVPLREGLGTDHMWDALKREIQDGELRVDAFEKPIEVVEDDLVVLALRQGQLESSVLFPWDHRMIAAFFEGISPDGARRLQNRMEAILDTTDIWYRMSDELLLQLFPTPVPVGLDFIRDRELRLKLWRDTTARFAQTFREDMAKAFLHLIPSVDSSDIEVDLANAELSGGTLSVALRDTSEGADIRCLCCSQYGDLDAQGVRRICQQLNELENAHLAIVLIVGDVLAEAWEEARARDMFGSLLVIPLHSTIAKRLLIAYECITRHTTAVDQKLFVEAVTRLYRADLDLSSKIKEWLRTGAETGLVLRDLYKATARGERELADSLKFYINVLGEPGSPEAVFAANQRLKSFVPFGVRTGFMPDIESAERLAAYTEDLARNGFVEYWPDRTVAVAQTPVERRFLRLLEAGPMPASTARERFVICARARNIFEDVYLNILKHKGRVTESSGQVSIVTTSQARTKAMEAKVACQRALGPLQQQHEWGAFAHVFVAKQRAKRFIRIDDVYDYLEAAEGAVQRVAGDAQEEVLLQKAALVTSLSEHLRKVLLPKVERAMNEGRRLAESTCDEVRGFLDDAAHAVEDYRRWAGLPADQLALREATQLSAEMQELAHIRSTPLLEQHVTPEEAEGEDFDHRAWDSPDRCFNVALVRVQRMSSSVKERLNQHRRTLGEVRQALSDLGRVGERTRNRFRMINVPPGCRIAASVYEGLAPLTATGPAQCEPADGRTPRATSPALTLAKMRDDLRALYQPLQDHFDKLDDAISALEQLVRVEGDFSVLTDQCAQTAAVISDMFDVPPAALRAKTFAEVQTNIARAYHELVSDAERLTPLDLTQSTTIATLQERLRALCAELNNALEEQRKTWQTFVADCQHFAGSVEHLLRLGKRQDHLLETSAVEARCKALIDSLAHQEWPKERLSAYEARKEEIRRATFRLLEKTLNPTEGHILLAVVERRDESQAGWLARPRLEKEIAGEMEQSEETVREALQALLAKGYLVEGVSIPM